MYTPIIEYNIGDMNFKSPANLSSRVMPRIGKQVVIKINPNKMDKPYIKSFLNYLFPWIFIVIGLYLIIIAIKSYLGL
jgi:hypothetical protein